MKEIFTIVMGNIYSINDFPESHRDFVSDCSHQGACDDDVEYWKSFFTVDDEEKLREYLETFGAWDDEELEDDDDNLKRLIWTMASDLKERGEAFTCL